MKVIGTAGHIDHGKSTLVERLTGIDPDRLIEEKRRGMTIDLGFAWVALPSGTEASIVDVPGHERFIKNMLAGAGGIDVALVVVAADEGVMPQTREHVHILDLLGVRAGVVALTKADLVDEEWLTLVRQEVGDLLSATALRDSPMVAVSALTGRGLGDLLVELDRAVSRAGEEPVTDVPFIPIDRVFTVSGFGKVATGTVHNGSIGVGDEIEVLPGGQRGRVRTMQTHGRQVDRAVAGARAALNLAPLNRADLQRGDVLARPGSIASVRRFDARVRVLGDAPFPLRHGAQAVLHLGSTERVANVTILGADELAPGTSGWVQLNTVAPVAAVRLQRFILRLPEPARTMAGGVVVDVRPRHRRSNPAALARLERLSGTDRMQVLQAVLEDNRPRNLEQVAEIAGYRRADVRELVQRGEREGSVVLRGDTVISRAGWDELVADVEGILGQFHDHNPLRVGMSREELRSRLHLPSGEWASTVNLLIRANVVQSEGTMLSLPGRQGGTAGRRDEAERVISLLHAHGYSPPTEADLLALAHSDSALLAAMVQEGDLVRVGAGLLFDRVTYERMVTMTLAAIEREGSITVAALRDMFGTSRKYALAFLEHLDGERLTRRQGDQRVLGSHRPACA